MTWRNSLFNEKENSDTLGLQHNTLHEYMLSEKFQSPVNVMNAGN